LLDLVYRLLDLVFRPAQHADLGAFAHEAQCGRLADPRSSACDQRDSSFKLHQSISLRWL
jgi:hypothetical protein